MAKLLWQVYFAEMLARNISGILRLLVMCFPPSHIAIRTPLSCSRAAIKSAKIPTKISFQMLFNCSGNVPCMVRPLLVSIRSMDVLAGGLPAVLPEWDWHPCVPCSERATLV